MSVFQNPHMAGRTGFSRAPRAGMAKTDQYGDGVRQALSQPSGMQMAPARQNFSAYSPQQQQSYQPQSMAPARQDFSSYSQPPAMPQQAAQPAPQPKITQTTVVNKAPMTQEQYKQRYDSFGPQSGGRWSDQQIFNAAQWSQQNPMTGGGNIGPGRPMA